MLAYPCDASCKMHGSCRICHMQNGVPHGCTKQMNRCIKPMPEMAHAPDKVRIPEEQFLENSCLFKVIRSASLFQLPSLLNACDAVATLIFGSSKVMQDNLRRYGANPCISCHKIHTWCKDNHDKTIVNQAQAPTNDSLMNKNVGSFQSTSLRKTESSIPGEQTLRANDSLMNCPSVPSCNPHFYWVSIPAELVS